MTTHPPVFTVVLLRELYAHMAWADARLWSAIISNVTAARDATIREKLVHVHLVQRVYLNTWTHRPWAMPRSHEVADLNTVWSWAYPYYAEVNGFLERATEDTIAETLPESLAKRIEETLGTRQVSPTVAESAFQVVHHSSHHRGQVNTRLRELHAEPPQVDYIAWLWHGRPAPEWTAPSATSSSTG